MATGAGHRVRVSLYVCMALGAGHRGRGVRGEGEAGAGDMEGAGGWA